MSTAGGTYVPDTFGFGYVKALAENYYGDVYQGRMFVLPSSLYEWIFGRGIILMGYGHGLSTDIGWLIDLNWGGIIYCFFLYLIVIKYVRLLKWKEDKQMILLFLLVLVIANTKGMYVQGDLFCLMTLLVFYSTSFYPRYINSYPKNKLK